MMARAVRVCLAEAASAWIDAELAKRIDREYKIIKPAVGYLSCPDHTLKRDILALLPDSEKLGITLTDSCAMIPDASICGLIFAHKKACYPEIRHISPEQYARYVSRRGFDEETASKFLGHLL